MHFLMLNVTPRHMLLLSLELSLLIPLDYLEFGEIRAHQTRLVPRRQIQLTHFLHLFLILLHENAYSDLLQLLIYPLLFLPVTIMKIIHLSLAPFDYGVHLSLKQTYNRWTRALSSIDQTFV